MMNIGEAAERCGLPSKTLRYYENLGLVVPGRQFGNEYRVYSSENLQHLVLLRRARAAGFNLDECRLLLARYKTPQQLNAATATALGLQLEYLERQLAELLELQAVLRALREQCGAPADTPVVVELPATNKSAITFTLIESETD